MIDQKKKGNKMQKTGKAFLLEHGFKEITADKIKEIIKPGKISKLSIDVSKPEPYMLLARSLEKNAFASYDRVAETEPECLIITKTDKFRTSLFDVPLNSLRDILFKNYNGKIIEIKFRLIEDDNNYKISFHKNVWPLKARLIHQKTKSLQRD